MSSANSTPTRFSRVLTALLVVCLAASATLLINNSTHGEPLSRHPIGPVNLTDTVEPPTITPTPTFTETPTPTPTATPTSTPTPTATATPTPTPSPTATATATFTPAPALPSTPIPTPNVPPPTPEVTATPIPLLPGTGGDGAQADPVLTAIYALLIASAVALAAGVRFVRRR